MPRRCAPSHRPFPLSGRLVTMSRAVGAGTGLAMRDPQTYLSLRRAAALCIGDAHARDSGQTLEKRAEARLHGVRVSPSLHEPIPDMAIWVDGATEGVTLVVDGDACRIPMVRVI